MDVFPLHAFAPPVPDPLDAQDILAFPHAAVFGHHGKPADSSSIDVHNFFTPASIKAASDYIREIQNLLLPPAISPLLSFEPYEDKLAAWKRFSWPFAGLCVLCDWIASGSRFFQHLETPMDLGTYWRDHALPAAESALLECGVLLPPPSRGLCFSSLFSQLALSPTPLQTHADTCPIPGAPQLHILEDITGCGKTEAALTLAGRLLDAGLAEGVYIALPTMATSNAMHARIGDSYRLLFAPEPPPSLVLAHGARDMSMRFLSSVAPKKPGPAFSKTDLLEDSGPWCSAWLADNHKKGLLAAVGVGTLDQALLAVLPARHQSLRLIGLARSILVVDEVHAYDTYTHNLLCRLLKFHASHHGSAILLSATLPINKRQELADSFLAGLEQNPITLASSEYPLASSISPLHAAEQPIEAWQGSRRAVAVHRLASVEEALEKTVQAAKDGASVCYIRNTVNDAIEAHSALARAPGVQDALLFHARFALCDRARIENQVLELFGKNSLPADRRGKVLVATQVVEQSLDLDFDLLVSDLAPVELMLQRAGRCHRHPRERPPGHHTPNIWIVSPGPDKDAERAWYSGMFPSAAHVYPEHGRLWQTARLLFSNPSYTLPQDARKLVEGVYGDNAADEVPKALAETDAKVWAELCGHTVLARMAALVLEEGYGGDGPWKEDTLTPTRLGEPSATLRLMVLENGELVPWAKDPDPKLAWAQSDLKVRAFHAAACPLPPGVSEAMLDRAKESMPDKGKWSLPLVLVSQGENLYYGKMENSKGLIQTVQYSRETGLTFPVE
jgi:CRISPR-associated endonuclease/helicase Cas3